MESIILGMIVAHSKARITRTIKNVNNVDNKRFLLAENFEFSNNFFSSQFCGLYSKNAIATPKTKGKQITRIVFTKSLICSNWLKNINSNKGMINEQEFTKILFFISSVI